MHHLRQVFPKHLIPTSNYYIPFVWQLVIGINNLIKLIPNPDLKVMLSNIKVVSKGSIGDVQKHHGPMYGDWINWPWLWSDLIVGLKLFNWIACWDKVIFHLTYLFQFDQCDHYYYWFEFGWVSGFQGNFVLVKFDPRLDCLNLELA